jgi:type VI secretion system protein VasD
MAMMMGFMTRCCCVLAMLSIAACGSAAPKPVATKLEVIAAADLNPDREGRPSPVVVRLFQLRTEGEFAGAKYFQLHDKEKETLGASLISRDELPAIAPGGHLLQELPVSPDTRFFGVLAGYQDAAAQGIAVVPVPPKSIKRILKEQRVTIRLNKTAAVLTVNEP